MEKKMDAASVSLVVGLSTILASGVTSSLVTFRLNRNKDQTIFMREKAEQLYLSADAYGRVFGGHMVSYFPLLEGRIDWNQMLDIHIADGSKEREHGGAETMTMLVEIYFPSVRPALARVWDARAEFNDLTAKLKRHYKANGHVTEDHWKPAFLEVTKKLNDAISCLEKDIVVAARRYAGVKQA
jgi:hypothetical protein